MYKLIKTSYRFSIPKADANGIFRYCDWANTFVKCIRFIVLKYI